MIDFRAPVLADKGWVDTLLQTADYRGCEYNFTNLFTWKDAYRHALAQTDGFLLVRLCGGLGCSYLYPVGAGDLRTAVLALEGEARAKGEPLRLVCLTGRQIAQLAAAFPGEFEFTPDRDGFDYLYEIDHLADLKGKQLHTKRNHLNHFLATNLTWVYEEMTPDNLEDCLHMDEEWYRRNRQREGAAEAKDLGNEGLALRLAIEHFEALRLEGGLIRVFGEVVAFTMGDRLSSDTFDVHFEKAYSDLRGAYATINQQFSARVREKYPAVRYLNREDDMGVPGLRSAKNSYIPDLMVEKYSAVRKDQA